MADRSAIRRGLSRPVFVVTNTDRQRIANGPVFLIEKNIPDAPGGGSVKSRSLSLGMGLSL